MTKTRDLADLGGGFIQAGTGAVQRTTESKLQDVVSVLDFIPPGTNTATTDCRGYIQAAIDYCYGNTTGNTLYFPAGNYLIGSTPGDDGVKHGLYIPYAGSVGSQAAATKSINIIGASRRTALLCGDDNMYLIRWSASHSSLSDMRLDNNGKNGCTGLALVGKDPTVSAGDQSNNSFERLVIRSFKVSGIKLQCARGDGSSSACYYNSFRDIHITGGGALGEAAIYFQSSPSGLTPHSNCNRNLFADIHISSCGPAVHVESAQGTNFYGLRCESINGTCVKIDNTDLNGLANGQTRFFGGDFESFTKGFENANPYTEIYGVNFGSFNDSTFSALPLVCIGGDGASLIPEITESFILDQNSLLSALGYKNAINLVKPIADFYDGTTRTWQSFPITTSNTNYADLIKEAKSYYYVLGGVCYWSLRLCWTAAAGNSGRIQIETPVTPDLNYHRNYGFINTSVVTNGAVLNGATIETAFGRFSNQSQNLNGNSYIQFTHSSGSFNTASFVNQLQVWIQFKVV